MRIHPGGFRTIFARLLMGMLSLVLVIVGPLAYYAMQTYRQTLEDHYHEEVDIVATSLASAAFEPTTSHRQPTVQGIVEEMTANSPVDLAFVLDGAGNYYAHTDTSLVGKRFLAGKHLEAFFDRSVPLDPGESDRFGVAHASISRERLDRELGSSQTAMAVIFVFSILVAAGLAVLFSSHTAQPIRSLTTAARTIASGNLNTSVETIRGPAEIQEMAHTFEEMRFSLQNHVSKLEASYRELDRKVHDISILYSVSEAMNAGDYSEGMLDKVLGEAVSGSAGRLGAVILRGDTEGKTRLVASRGIDIRSSADPHREMLESVALAAMEEQGPSIGEFADAGLSRPSGPGTLHVFGVPLLVRTDVAGALVVARDKGAPGNEDAALVVALASHAARCVERAQLYAASITDGLTGLYVSRYFRLRLKEELRTAARYGRSLSMCMVDIDFFKKVNDTYGHQAGDDVLRVVAQCLMEAVREDIDIAARYGGEEFGLILPETDKEGAKVFAERLREFVGEQKVENDAQVIQVTISIGVATSPEDGVEPEALVEKADAALYQAKRDGRNRVVTA